MIRDIHERRLVAQLRKEATEVKDCFTSFAFQGITIGSAGLAVLFGAMEKVPYCVYAGVPLVAVLMIVSRIGIYKYTTANRNYGYELHLARTRWIEQSGQRSGWSSDMREIRWEEALRAWRVVQIAIFRAIYKTPQTDYLTGLLGPIKIFNWIRYVRPEFYRLRDPSKEIVMAHREGRADYEHGYPWFMPKLLTRHAVSRSGARESYYYAGTYLKGMVLVLFVLQYMVLAPLAVDAVLAASQDREYRPQLVVLTLTAGFVFLRDIRLRRRRTILEDELLSIHSCAIMWQAVVQAHYAALKSPMGGYPGYTEELARVARYVARNVFRMHAVLRDLSPDAWARGVNTSRMKARSRSPTSPTPRSSPT